MSRAVDIEGWSKFLDAPYVERCWDNYVLSSKSGFVFGKKSHAYSTSKVTNTQRTKMDFLQILNRVLEEKWDDCVSFYCGLLVFCLKKKQRSFKFVKDNEVPNTRSLSSCLKNKKFPISYRDKIKKIWKNKYSFQDFIVAASKLPYNKFDVKSALEVYELQGDKAIFSILSQMFWHGSRGRPFNIVLTPELPISKKFEPSKFVSGVVFPCVVSKYPKKITNEFINDGWFLLDDNGLILDCVGVGQYNLWQEPLSTRLGYLGRGGISTGLICWCWGDIVKAVGHYKGDVLVRSLNEPLLQANWHKFGPHGKVSVIVNGTKIYTQKNRNKPITNKRIKDRNRMGYEVREMMLNGTVLGRTTEKEIVYSQEELEDWFELAELCKKELKKKKIIE